MKRSRSAENIIFGGITVNEQNQCTLPNPVLRYHIKKQIKNFKK